MFLKKHPPTWFPTLPVPTGGSPPSTTHGALTVCRVGAAKGIQADTADHAHAIAHVSTTSIVLNLLAVSCEGAVDLRIVDGATLGHCGGRSSVLADAKACPPSRRGEADANGLTRAGNGTTGSTTTTGASAASTGARARTGARTGASTTAGTAASASGGRRPTSRSAPQLARTSDQGIQQSFFFHFKEIDMFCRRHRQEGDKARTTNV